MLWIELFVVDSTLRFLAAMADCQADMDADGEGPNTIWTPWLENRPSSLNRNMDYNPPLNKAVWGMMTV